jgi:alkaline phosphatase
LKGYEIIHSPQEIPDIPQWRTRLLLGLFDYPYALFDPEAHSTSPTLEEMVILSIECLQFNMGGYFLVAVHPDPNNLLDSDQLEYRKAHVYQLNTALQAAINYSGKNATVLLYVPQPGTTGVLIQLKGDATPAGILTLQQLHTYISSQL